MRMEIKLPAGGRYSLTHGAELARQKRVYGSRFTDILFLTEYATLISHLR